MDDSCSSRLQIGMWPEDPIWPRRVADAPEVDDVDDNCVEDPSETLAAIRAVDPSF